MSGNGSHPSSALRLALLGLRGCSSCRGLRWLLLGTEVAGSPLQEHPRPREPLPGTVRIYNEALGLPWGEASGQERADFSSSADLSQGPFSPAPDDSGVNGNRVLELSPDPHTFMAISSCISTAFSRSSRWLSPRGLTS